jgi:hypothetical protein
MKIKINEKLKGVDGVEVLKGDKGVPLTFKDICINALLTPEQGDDDKKKWEKYEVFKKVRDAKDTLELKVEDITLIKKCIGKTSPPLVMGQCWEILERNGKDS